MFREQVLHAAGSEYLRVGDHGSGEPPGLPGASDGKRLGRVGLRFSLGLKLRSQLSAVVGPRLVNTNRAQLSLGAGLAANDEHGVVMHLADQATPQELRLTATGGSFAGGRVRLAVHWLALRVPDPV